MAQRAFDLCFIDKGWSQVNFVLLYRADTAVLVIHSTVSSKLINYFVFIAKSPHHWSIVVLLEMYSQLFVGSSAVVFVKYWVGPIFVFVPSCVVYTWSWLGFLVNKLFLKTVYYCFLLQSNVYSSKLNNTQGAADLDVIVKRTKITIEICSDYDFTMLLCISFMRLIVNSVFVLHTAY